METIFDLRDVSYTYIRRFEALRNVTLSFKAGEQTAILGANGSGKSTLLSILNALTYPTSGEFSAFGTPIKEEVFDTLEENEFARFFRKKVGFLFQNPDIQLFSSTVFDEIAFGPLQLDLPPEEVQKRTEEVIAMLGIENLRDRAPHMLSGGEKKKVCIASILSTNPDVLLLDEPTGVLTRAARCGSLRSSRISQRPGKRLLRQPMTSILSNRSVPAPLLSVKIIQYMLIVTVQV